jgi:hypothetical protein
MKEMIVQRSEALKKADDLINGPRARTYGDAFETHDSIAKIMSVLLKDKLKSDLTFEDIYKVFIVGKLVRDRGNSEKNIKHMDNPIDVIGFAALWAEGKSEVNGGSKNGKNGN